MQGPEKAYDAFLASTGFGSPPAPLFGSKGSGASGGRQYAGPGEQKFADVYQQGSPPSMPRKIPGTDSMTVDSANVAGQLDPKSVLQPRPPGYAFPSGSVLGQKSVFAPGGPGDTFQDNYAAVGIWGDMHAKSAEPGSTFKPHSKAEGEKRMRASMAKQLAAIEDLRDGSSSQYGHGRGQGQSQGRGRGNATDGGFPSGRELVAKFAPSLTSNRYASGEKQSGVSRGQIPYVLGFAFFILVFIASGVKWSTNRDNKSWLGASVASFVLAGGSLALYLSARSNENSTEENMQGSSSTFVAGGEPIGDDRVALMGRNMPRGVNPLQRDQRNVVPYPQPTDYPTDFQQRLDAQGTNSNLLEGPRAHLGYRRAPPTPDGRQTLPANKLMRSPGNNNMDSGTFNEFMRRLSGEAPNQFYQAHPYMTFAPQFENRSQINDAESVFGISTQPGQMLRQSIYREPKIQQAGAKTMHLKDPPPGSVQPLEKVHPWLQKDESGQEPAVMMATPATSTIGQERLQGRSPSYGLPPSASGSTNAYHPAFVPGGNTRGMNAYGENAYDGNAYGAPRVMQAAKGKVDDLFDLPTSTISSESKLTPQDAKTFEMERLEESKKFEGAGRQGDKDFLQPQGTASSRKNTLSQIQASGGSMGFGETGPQQEAAGHGHGMRGSEFEPRPPLNEAQQHMGPPPEPIKVERPGRSGAQKPPLPADLQPVYQPETPEQMRGDKAQEAMRQGAMRQGAMRQEDQAESQSQVGGGMHGQNDDGLGFLGEDDSGGGGFFAAFAEKKQPTEDDIAKAQLDTR